MIEIQVTYMSHQTAYFPIDPGEGWRVDPAGRTLVVGHGVPRIHVPLDNVLFFTLVDRPDAPQQMTHDEIAAFFEEKLGAPPLCSGCGRPVGTP